MVSVVSVVSLDTTDTTNSLAHLVSCWNLMIFHWKTPHFGVSKFWSRDCSVHKHELSRNLVLCHVTYISTNQNALNFKISRDNVRFQAIFFPFKEQSCYTALLKTNDLLCHSLGSIWSGGVTVTGSLQYNLSVDSICILGALSGHISCLFEYIRWHRCTLKF